MKTVTYNKLVRDKIPTILKDQNISSETRILNDDEFKRHLLQKLQEEVIELINAHNETNFFEELADVIEVLTTIKKSFSIDSQILKKIRSQKNKERGKFNRQILLISTTNSV